MFTGIIEGLGAVTAVRPAAGGQRLVITAPFPLQGSRIGDSIAVSGACLTAVAISGNRFEVDVSPETVARTTFGGIKAGDRVNLERSLRIGDRLDGHLVSGHVDATGVLAGRTRQGNADVLAFEVPESLSSYMIEKGSVAVDGVSLTINHCRPGRFEVSIIPHTAGLTTVGFKRVGDPVNIETDMIAKYVERFVHAGSDGVSGRSRPESTLTMELLARNGFV
jgi:riboflavin synthase